MYQIGKKWKLQFGSCNVRNWKLRVEVLSIDFPFWSLEKDRRFNFPAPLIFGMGWNKLSGSRKEIIEIESWKLFDESRWKLKLKVARWPFSGPVTSPSEDPLSCSHKMITDTVEVGFEWGGIDTKGRRKSSWPDIFLMVVKTADRKWNIMTIITGMEIRLKKLPLPTSDFQLLTLQLLTSNFLSQFIE